MKVCIGCQQTLSLSAFPVSRSRGKYLPRCRECTADQRRNAKHGMTRGEKLGIVRAQNGCAICGIEIPGQKGWVVDHDRSCCIGDYSCSDCRRGVLCSWCNTALGYAKDNPENLRRMADYLESGTRL